LQRDDVGAEHLDVLLAGGAGDLSDVGAARHEQQGDEEPASAPRRGDDLAQRGLTRK
jgi:hypothetical protein